MSGPKSLHTFFASFPQAAPWPSRMWQIYFYRFAVHLTLLANLTLTVGNITMRCSTLSRTSLPRSLLMSAFTFLMVETSINRCVGRSSLWYIILQIWPGPNSSLKIDGLKPYYPFSVCAMVVVWTSRLFSLFHPFVIAHWTCYHFLKSLHMEYWGSSVVTPQLEDCLRGDGDYRVNERVFPGVPICSSSHNPIPTGPIGVVNLLSTMDVISISTYLYL